MRYRNFALSWAFGFALMVQLAWADAPTDSTSEFQLELTDQSYEEWRDHILPATSELEFEKIPWLVTFKDGILAADAQQKPLLFWTMNGHPLGCT